MLLNLKNVSAGYNGQKVLHEVSFGFEHGQNYCILGHQGQASHFIRASHIFNK